MTKSEQEAESNSKRHQRANSNDIKNAAQKITHQRANNLMRAITEFKSTLATSGSLSLWLDACRHFGRTLVATFSQKSNEVEPVMASTGEVEDQTSSRCGGGALAFGTHRHSGTSVCLGCTLHVDRLRGRGRHSKAPCRSVPSTIETRTLVAALIIN